MKRFFYKCFVLGMAVIMPLGFYMNLAQAAPHNAARHREEVRRHDRDKDHEKRQKEYKKKIREEKRRYEKAIKRRPGESRHAWERRKYEEERRHDRKVREIEALILGIVIGIAVH